MKRYIVYGMSCAACSAKVEKAVRGVGGVQSCSVNLLTNSMTVEGADDESVIGAVRAAGYDADVSDGGVDTDKLQLEEKREHKRLLARLITSAAILFALMYISMGYVMWGFWLPEILRSNPIAIALIELVLSGAVLVINRRFFVTGTLAIIRRAPNMDSLVAIGSAVAYLWSLYLTLSAVFSGDASHHFLHELYFEASAMIPALITLGKMLESFAKGKTTDSIRSLMALTPPLARLERGGQELTVLISEVKIGDVFVVKPGDSLPADGVVINGFSAVDESSLTGESIPVEKKEGSHVFAGSQNTSGFLKCRVTKLGEDTLMGEIIRMVSDASSSKAPIAKVADRVAGIFVPLVVLIAFITTVAWIFINNSLGYALARGIAVLVISCPCALGLATPVAIMVGSGIGARGGVLFKTATSLELSGRVKTVVLDKTGTITEGAPTVSDVIPLLCEKHEFVRIAASLEAKSEHPLAAAITEYAASNGSSLYEAEDFQAFVGSGVRAVINSKEVFGGSYNFISELLNESLDEKLYRDLAKEGKTPIYFASGSTLLGIIAVSDKIKADSKRAVAALNKMGIKTLMLTGDSKIVAEAIAKDAGISEFRAELLPGGKAELVKELSCGGRVMMVGDGINDAPALTAADVGVAIGAGTDIAIESADVVLMDSSLSGVVSAVKLGRAVLSNIKQNLFWAFCYNIIGIPLAQGLFIPILGWDLDPMFGAAAMSISSFLVVMNALRLNTGKFFEVNNKNKENVNMVKLRVTGMMCKHCEARVKEALLAVEGVSCAEANHKKKEATVELSSEIDTAALVDAVVKAGYKCTLA